MTIEPPGRAPTPYIPLTAADREAMLGRLGIASVDDLFDQLPAALRDPAIHLPPALDEAGLVRAFRELAGRNPTGNDRPSFLGAGAYRRSIPAVVPHLVSRSEFVTSYTPYQPEISQGTLQAAFEYQSVVCELTGMDVSNTGMYDGASATAEACLLAARVTRRRAIAVLEPLHPNVVDVIRTYAFGIDLQVDQLAAASEVTEAHACLVVQQPDFLGTILDIEPIAAAAHAAGALCIVMADPFSLGLLRPPGDAGADLVTGEGRDLAGPMAYGGPSLGILAAREGLLRQMPGRIVGRTQELHGRNGDAPRTGYVLTLQAREQFIRRAQATSNFSTGQALIALAFTITVESLGPEGLRRAAGYCYQQAHSAAARVTDIPGFAVIERGPWFQEFLVRGPLEPPGLLRRLRELGIEGGLDVSARPESAASGAILVCVTEATPPAHIDAFVSALRTISSEVLGP